jgi:hypothetical protein
MAYLYEMLVSNGGFLGQLFKTELKATYLIKKLQYLSKSLPQFRRNV